MVAVVKQVVWVQRNITRSTSGYPYYVHLVTRLYLPTFCTDPDSRLNIRRISQWSVNDNPHTLELG
jgi:hypothetical protein